MAFWQKFFLSTFLIYAAARAEFPPETFPPDGSEPSYEEGESRAADEEYLNPKRKRQRASPKPKPVGPTRSGGVFKQPLSEEDSPALPPFKSKLRLSLMTGLSKLSEDNASFENGITQLELKDHFLMGGFAEYQFTRLLGAEIDGFTASTAVNEIIPEGDINAYLVGFSEFYLVPQVRLQLPLKLGPVQALGKLGLGYGFFSVSQTRTPVATGVEQALSISVSGVVLSTGLEGSFGPNVRAFFDFGFSPFGSGRLRGNGDTGVVDDIISAPTFWSFRLGGSVKILDWLEAGPLLAIRKLNAAHPTDVLQQYKMSLGQREMLLQLLVFATVTL